MWQHTISRFLFATAHKLVPFSHRHLQSMGKGRYLNGIHNCQLAQYHSTQNQPVNTLSLSRENCLQWKEPEQLQLGVFVRHPSLPSWAVASCQVCFQTILPAELPTLLKTWLGRRLCDSTKLYSAAGLLSSFLVISLPTSPLEVWECI